MFLERRFDITVPNISPWHRAVCGDLTSAFDFGNPQNAALPALPDMSNYAVIDAQQQAKGKYVVPATNQLPVQERGVRLSRKLPYELHVDAAVKAGVSVELAFANTGSQGAVFHVYDKLHLDRIPRRYTVEAGKRLSDVWNTASDRGRHELWVYGPNGFVRAFKADAAADAAALPDIGVRYAGRAGALTVRFANPGKEARRLTVRDNAYRSGGPAVVQVPAGKTVEHHFAIGRSAHWYDFSVLCDAIPGYERRFAGRMETGRHGYSDPATGVA